MILQDLISVIVPVYNVAKYLDACIVSIQKQTYTNLEILLIDDGSTDGSGDICDKYALTDKRIKVIHQRNVGLSATRNKGISISRGEYISFVDSDDFINKRFIETMYNIMIESGCDLACVESINFYDGDEEKVYSYWGKTNDSQKQYTVYPSEHMLNNALYQYVSITGAPLKLYRKKLFLNIEFPVGRYYEDLATTYLFILKSNYVSVHHQRLYAYRIRKNSIINGIFSGRCMDCIWVGEKLVEDLKDMPLRVKSATHCAAFRINRIVFPKIPFCNRIQKDEVWNEILRYRKSVIFDRNAQKYERLIALSSFCGQYIFTGILFLFNIAREIRIKMQLRTR